VGVTVAVAVTVPVRVAVEVGVAVNVGRLVLVGVTLGVAVGRTLAGLQPAAQVTPLLLLKITEQLRERHKLVQLSIAPGMLSTQNPVPHDPPSHTQHAAAAGRVASGSKETMPVLSVASSSHA
jgi:hypothetical protein